MEIENSDDGDLLQSLRRETEPHCHVFRRLVQNSANLNYIGNYISILVEALFITIKRNFIDSMRILLEEGASPNFRLEGTEKRPLHYCSSDKQGIEVLRELLKHGADVNAEDKAKRTPLHYATLHGCVENMKKLLQNGATVDAIDEFGNTPLLRAVIHFTNISTVQVLLSAGADVNFCDGGGVTALHYAVRFHLPHVVRLLLQHNACTNVRDDYGNTPLHCSVFDEHEPTESIRELLKHGASLHERNKEERSPLLYAISKVQEEITQELLCYGAPFDLFDCLEALLYCGQPLHKITAMAHKLIRYAFLENSNSLARVRRELRYIRVVSILEILPSPESNLVSFTNACYSEVQTLSKKRCGCGKSSIWRSINNCEVCDCNTQQAILKFLFSGRPTNFGDAFFYKLSKEFLLEVTLDLMSYFEFKESEKRLILPWTCRKAVERYVSVGDVVSYLQSKQSKMDASEFEKFLSFKKPESLDKLSSEISPPGPKKLRVS